MKMRANAGELIAWLETHAAMPDDVAVSEITAADALAVMRVVRAAEETIRLGGLKSTFAELGAALAELEKR